MRYLFGLLKRWWWWYRTALRSGSRLEHARWAWRVARSTWRDEWQ